MSNSAQASATLLSGFAPPPAGFHQMAVALPRVDRGEFSDHIIFGIDRLLEFCGANRGQSLDHCCFGRHFGVFSGSATEKPSAPREADDQGADQPPTANP